MPEALSYEVTNVNLYPVPMDLVFNEPVGLVGRWMGTRGEVAATYARGKVGVRTGRLKASIRMTQDRKAPGRAQQVRIGTGGTGRGYALLHHEGTKPHVITGKRGRFMTFSIRGRRVYTRVVRHPGTRPNHYLTDSLKVFMP